MEGIKRDVDVFGKLKRVFRNRTFLAVFLGQLAFFFLFGLMFSYGPIYAKERFGFLNEHIGLLFFTYYVLNALVRFSLTKIVTIRRETKDVLFLSSLLGAAVLAIIMGFTELPIIFMIGFVLVGMLQGMLFPVGVMLVNASVGARDVILANSAILMALDIGQASAPIVTAPLVITIGTAFTFVFSSVLIIAFMIIYSYLRIGKKKL